MSWVNPLDKLPQVPSDWANHVIYGGLLGAISAVLYVAVRNADVSNAWLFGTAVTFAVTAVKKIVDYHMEIETVEMCVGKTFVTALLPFCFYLNKLL